MKMILISLQSLLMVQKSHRVMMFLKMAPARTRFDMEDPTLGDRISALEQCLFGTLSPPLLPKYQLPQPTPLGNPAPLGLLGFATASLLTAVLKISSDESARTTGTFAATAIFLGGLAQLVTAVFQLLHNNAHAAASFGLFGFHWLTVGLQIWVNSTTTDAFVTSENRLSAASYSGIFAVMTLILWIPTLRMNAVLSSQFTALFFVFVTEIPAAYGVRAAEVSSGIIQGIAGTLGAYLALLDLVNETWRRPVLPLFPHRDHRDEYQGELKGVYVPKKNYHKSSVSLIHL